MKLTFIVPALNLTGGLRVISIYANLLSKRGHTVTVISPCEKKPSFKERLKYLLRWKNYEFNSGYDDTFFKNSNYEVIVLKKEGPIKATSVPDADVVVATFWNTAEWLADFPESKGRKVYFIQHYEVHPWLPVERVKATFNLPYKKIVVAQWIADILKAEYGQDSIVISNAVDHKLFYAPSREGNKQTTFCMMYSQRAYKGSQWAFECYKKLQGLHPEVKLLVFGMNAPDDVINLPEGAEYIHKPEQDDIREIYSRCDAYLFTSSVEGFGLPILEAMACRTPVIGTQCGAAPDLLVGGGGVLIEREDSEGLLAAMEWICFSKGAAWMLMSDTAYKESQNHSWESKGGDVEAVLLGLKED